MDTYKNLVDVLCTITAGERKRLVAQIAGTTETATNDHFLEFVAKESKAFIEALSQKLKKLRYDDLLILYTVACGELPATSEEQKALATALSAYHNLFGELPEQFSQLG